MLINVMLIKKNMYEISTCGSSYAHFIKYKSRILLYVVNELFDTNKLHSCNASMADKDVLFDIIF